MEPAEVVTEVGMEAAEVTGRLTTTTVKTARTAGATMANPGRDVATTDRALRLNNHLAGGCTAEMRRKVM